MLDPCAEKVVDVIIIERIKGGPPFFPDSNEAQIPKGTEVMTHGRLTHL
jgi:hypothetical protein